MRWAVTPALGLLAGALLVSGLAFDVRWASSEPALRVAARQARDANRAGWLTDHSGWHGLYDVRRVRVDGPYVIVATRGGTRFRWSDQAPAVDRRRPSPGWGIAGRYD